MIEIKRARPLALIADSDPSHRKILAFALKKLEIDTIEVDSAKEYIDKMRHHTPDVSFVDLNLEGLGVGFTVVKAVRRAMGTLPYIVVTADTAEITAITHAMESGANDCLVKPYDLNILAAKMTRVIRTEALLASTPQLLPIPDGGVEASLFLDLEILSVRETGFEFLSKHWIAKGVPIYVDSPELQSITGRPAPLLLIIQDSWVADDQTRYGLATQFDERDVELRQKLRSWLTQRSTKTQESTQNSP